MTTLLPPSSTALKQCRISPETRLLPVSSVASSCRALFAYPSISSLVISGQPPLASGYRSSQSRKASLSLSVSPRQPHLRSRGQIGGVAELVVCSASSTPSGFPVTEGEEVFFDGGVHFGDLVVNLLFGFTLVWIPLTLTAIARGLFLRYRFSNLRITVQSGVLGGDRKDLSYDVIKGVKVVPRFIGEWGDMAIELKDGTNVDVRCVPRFREIASYIEMRMGDQASSPATGGGTPRKGFS